MSRAEDEKLQVLIVGQVAQDMNKTSYCRSIVMAEKPRTPGYNVIMTGWRVPAPVACKRPATESGATCCFLLPFGVAEV